MKYKAGRSGGPSYWPAGGEAAGRVINRGTRSSRGGETILTRLFKIATSAPGPDKIPLPAPGPSTPIRESQPLSDKRPCVHSNLMENVKRWFTGYPLTGLSPGGRASRNSAMCSSMSGGTSGNLSPPFMPLRNAPHFSQRSRCARNRTFMVGESWLSM